MGTFLVVVLIISVVMFFVSWSHKGNSAKDGAWSGGFCAIILLVIGFTIIFFVNELKSCASHSPSREYYDSPRK